MKIRGKNKKKKGVGRTLKSLLENLTRNCKCSNPQGKLWSIGNPF